MKRPVNEIPAKILPLSSIIGDTGKTSKKEEKEIEALAADIKIKGQLYPIIVLSPLPHRESYRLVRGNKRLNAIRELGWKEINAIIIPSSLDALVAMDDPDAEATVERFADIMEKLQTKAMSDFDIAKAAIEMKARHGIKGAEFAAVLGLSQGYVYNLTRWYKAAHPEILAAWCEDHPLINQSELERMSHMPRHEALDYFLKRVTMRTTPEPFQPGKKPKGHSNGNGNGKHERNRRASEIQLVKLQDAIDESDLNVDVKLLCKNIIKFALGASKDVPGITNYHKLPKTILSKRVSRESTAA